MNKYGTSFPQEDNWSLQLVIHIWLNNGKHDKGLRISKIVYR